ncbi:hypothetical protein GCM10023322_15400 [Rugosimonospora acidiphila]|uniref:Biotin synthase auxiliary protein n=1 Tax=Rugosimonospora acidiphila TaxID=556531 RepID=A0ABP9RMF0_9ACTN
MNPIAIEHPAADVYCDRCGGELAGGAHPACRAARALEPPRYCPTCRRRMKVQVLPAGWRAQCVEHGEARG